MDAVNEQNLKNLVRAVFVAAMVGVFGGTLNKVEPTVVVPVTRVIDLDGQSYEVGYDFTAKMAEGAEPRVSLRGQPQFRVFGYQVQGPKVDLNVPDLNVPQVFKR